MLLYPTLLLHVTCGGKIQGRVEVNVTPVCRKMAKSGPKIAQLLACTRNCYKWLFERTELFAIGDYDFGTRKSACNGQVFVVSDLVVTTTQCNCVFERFPVRYKIPYETDFKLCLHVALASGSA